MVISTKKLNSVPTLMFLCKEDLFCGMTGTQCSFIGVCNDKNLKLWTAEFLELNMPFAQIEEIPYITPKPLFTSGAMPYDATESREIVMAFNLTNSEKFNHYWIEALTLKSG